MELEERRSEPDYRDTYPNIKYTKKNRTFVVN